MKTKICSRCKIEKPYEKFGKNKATFDNMSRRCKKCKNKAGRLYRRKYPEKFTWAYRKKRYPKLLEKQKAYDKERSKRPARQTYMRKYQREYITQRKLKFLQGKNCENCNSTHRHVSFFSKKGGSKIRDLRPWYGKVARGKYLILCRPCWEKESSERISWHWQQGTYDHIPQILHEYAEYATAADVMDGSEKQDGHSLLYFTYQLTKDFPYAIRDDMCQEMVFDVLSKKVEMEELPNLLRKYRSRAYQKFMPKYGELSLNHPLYRDSDTPLEEILVQSEDK